jgi:hypothetical protein
MIYDIRLDRPEGMAYIMEHSQMLNFSSPCKEYTLTFEDTGKAAYAYLKRGKEIVGVVWLYNRCPTPAQIEWADPKKADPKNIPFANCEGYMAKEGRIAHDVRPTDVIVNWESDDRGPVAYVYIFEDLYGVLGVGDEPGYARFAVKDSPLARVMVIEPANEGPQA